MSVQDASTGTSNWAEKFDSLSDQESEVNWRPFPEQYMTKPMPMPIRTKQISSCPTVHVIAKIPEDLTVHENYTQDEESIPPRVFCWNDISTLDVRVASKTVRGALEMEYRRLIKDMTIEFASAKKGAKGRDDAELMICHLLDPTPTQTKITTRISRIASSFSDNQVNAMKRLGSKGLLMPRLLNDDALITMVESISCRTIFILDCSSVGRAIDRMLETGKDFVVFGATTESIPFAPQLPCDLFTSCLLTPGKIAILTQTHTYGDIRSGMLTPMQLPDFISMLDKSTNYLREVIEFVEATLELVADRIAFETMQPEVSSFSKLFRSDPLTAKLYYNFMFACRVMRYVSTTPVSYPPLPDMTNHPLWDSFDFQVDRALYSLRYNPRERFTLDMFLEEQMTQLESWIRFPRDNRKMPDELAALGMLIASPKFVKRALRFSAQFVSISSSTTEKFLASRAFPALVDLVGKIDETDAETLADFSFAIASCVLLAPELKSLFVDKVCFWQRLLMSNESESLIIACLCCLMLFGSCDELADRLVSFTKHESPKIRTLSHLLLARMNVRLELPIKKASKENDPLARAAFVCRITTTVRSSGLDDRNYLELFYDLIMSINDKFQYVREEALVAMSHALKTKKGLDFDAFREYITDWDESNAADALVTLLAHELRTVFFEPSKIVRARYTMFLAFFADILNGKDPEPFESTLGNACLSEILHSNTQIEEEPVTIVPKALFLSNSDKLCGKPAMSPSGLLACGDVNGRVFCQNPFNTRIYDFFKPDPPETTIPPLFSSLISSNSLKVHIEYLTFVDDSKVLAISNRSQVAVIDADNPHDAICSFCMAYPDRTEELHADYNSQTFRIAEIAGFAPAAIFDLETQKKIREIRIERTKASRIEWYKPFQSLLCVAQEGVTLYDERTREEEKIVTIPEPGLDLVGCNASFSMPSYLFCGHATGKVTMWDLRNMRAVCSSVSKKKLQQFEVHKHLPFAFGLSDTTLFTLTCDNGELTRHYHEVKFPVHHFGLHSSETTCAVRSGNNVSFFEIQVTV